MRNISTASLIKLAQKKGTEPITLVEVGWQTGQLAKMYGDRKFDGVDGRILSVANLEDILNVSKNGTSQTVTITFDDADGALKEIFNQTDIHKKSVWIYQWFTGIPIADRILIFDGVIASPIVWKEGDRTLTFSVISRAEDMEIGFSPEEGQFPTLPENMIGSVWPLIFGTVIKLPLQLVDKITQNSNTGNTTPTTAAGTGIADPSLAPHLKRVDSYYTQSIQLAQLYFVGYLLASSKARRNKELGEFDRIQRGKGPFSAKAKQYLDLGNKWLLAAQKALRSNQNLRAIHDKQKSHELSSIPIRNGGSFPENVTVNASIGGALHVGYFAENSFHVNDRVHPATEKYTGITQPTTVTTMTTIPRDNFFWADAGSSIFIENTDNDPTNDATPVRYIVASTIPVQVLEVYAMRTVNDVTSLNVVPTNYYEVLQVGFGSLPVTMLYLPHPLSSKIQSDRKTEGWADDLFATVQSPIGPNTVDIMIWMIENYTDHEIDATSFNAVRSMISPFPSHFAIMDRPTITKVLADIAYQARCIIYLKNNTYYLKYLAQMETPVATITEADIIEQSLSVEYTETEDLVTKWVLEWQDNYKTTKKNLIVLRYNIGPYGAIEKRYNYFIYNMQQLVERSGTFWLIREANTFKRVRLTVPIKFLNVETLDTITLNFTHPFIAYGPIPCVVEEASVDTSNYTIDMVLWVPVRAGEMTLYQFAYPGGVSIEYIFPTAEDIIQGRAGGGRNEFNASVTPPTSGKASGNFSGSEGAGGTLHVTDRPYTWGTDPGYGPDATAVAPTVQTRIDSVGVAALGKKPAGTTEYQIDAPLLIEDKVDDIQSMVIPGKIASGENGIYSVNLYYQGLSASPTLKENVVAIQLDDSDDNSLAEGTGVMVLQFVFDDDKGDEQIEYYIQPAVWQ